MKVNLAALKILLTIVILIPTINLKVYGQDDDSFEERNNNLFVPKLSQPDFTSVLTFPINTLPAYMMVMVSISTETEIFLKIAGCIRK
ncbi:MAG: hypothetical protein IPG39_23105 [Bacteroidetes bacterium]|nr:hypothetical protein [Bacteroidota bacterium]